MNDNNSPSYYLNLDVALARASESAQQDCLHYYDGVAIDNPPLNLIRVPVEKFTLFFSETLLPLPDKMIDATGQMASGAQWDVFQEVLQEVREFRAKNSLLFRAKPARDTYFIDRQIAWHIARQGNRVHTQHPRIDGLQLCFYDGEPFTGEVPQNLIHVPSQDLISYLIHTGYRLPQEIYIPLSVDDEERDQITTLFKELLNNVEQQRVTLANEICRLCQSLKPDFKDDQWRILLVSSRHTEVLQYVAKGLTKALNQIGVNARLLIEDNDMQQLSWPLILAEHYEFNPHITVNLDRIGSECLASEVINFIWWQDPVPPLTNSAAKIMLRDRDITLSLSTALDRLLRLKGVNSIVRQRFCIDSEIFNLKASVVRENKVVFIGSSYYLSMQNASEQEKHLVTEYFQQLEKGEVIDEAFIRQMVAKYQVDYNRASTYLLNYVVREISVTWLCKIPSIKVEVYGRYWEHNAEVAPFYKGELPHGEAVAAVYQSARYALVSHPTEIHSQRLLEATACGCIPVVYDCRFHAETPHWDDECLFFHDAASLQNCLSQRPENNPMSIAAKDTYIALAQRIIQLSKDKLRELQVKTA